MPLSPADIALVLVVTAQAALMAYVHSPRLKALIYTLPLPFTAATLSVGKPVDATNVWGWAALFAYVWLARFLYLRCRVPILAAIVGSAVTYVLLGWAIARSVGPSDWAFWLAAGAVWCAALALAMVLPPREEPGHRSALPIWAKLPPILVIVLLMVLLKNTLRGFVTTFPYVGVFAVYEARHSLWTLGRQVPIFAIAAVPMIVAIRLLQSAIGLPAALAAGWAVFLPILYVIYRSRLARKV